MKIKICGLSNANEVEECTKLGAEYCGFILNFPKSHRYISFDKARALTNITKINSKYVGVLVNPSDKDLEKFAELNLDYFQLYGKYTDEILFRIKKKFGKKIISTVQVKEKKDILNYKLFLKSSDIILWDSSGYEKSYSWNYDWIKKIKIKAKKMIAGNISLEKIDTISSLADIVDVSGALETNKVKDINKIKKFISKVKKL
tara:strand:- start:459 stop:1064 length:606 start_codon:yes stop_codon:yes gene_type:complete